MPSHVKFGLILLMIGSAVTFGFLVDIVGRIQSIVNDPETQENPFGAPAQPLYEPSDPPMTVKIFFASASGNTLLAAEDRTIFQSSEIANRARQILQELQQGPRSPDMLPPLPDEAKLDDLFVSEAGLVFVDFTSPISTNHPGGIPNELATIYAIVNSLTYNLPEIREVKLLIGGTEKETLAGHCLLLLPFTMDLSITDLREFTEDEPMLEGRLAAQP